MIFFFIFEKWEGALGVHIPRPLCIFLSGTRITSNLTCNFYSKRSKGERVKGNDSLEISYTVFSITKIRFFQISCAVHVLEKWFNSKNYKFYTPYIIVRSAPFCCEQTLHILSSHKHTCLYVKKTYCYLVHVSCQHLSDERKFNCSPVVPCFGAVTNQNARLI